MDLEHAAYLIRLAKSVNEVDFNYSWYADLFDDDSYPKCQG